MNDKVKIVDAQNTFCPGPLMELIGQIKQCQIGEIIELLSSDKGSAQDIPEWVNKVGHEILSNEEIDGVWHIQVRKVK